MSTTWPQLLRRLVAGDDLPREDVAWAMDQVMTGQVPPARLAGLLVALRAKGETVEELTALADVMLEHAVPYAAPVERAVDMTVMTTGHHEFKQKKLVRTTVEAFPMQGAGASAVIGRADGERGAIYLQQ